VLLPCLDGKGARRRDPLGPLEGLEGLQVRTQGVRLQGLVQEQVVVGQRLDLPGGGNKVVGRVLRHVVLGLCQQVQFHLRKDLVFPQGLIIGLRTLGFPVHLPLDLLKLIVDV